MRRNEAGDGALRTESIRDMRNGERKRRLRALIDSWRGDRDDDPVRADRPLTRGDCIDGPRPCPWASCRHHLALDVNERTGSITFIAPSPRIEGAAPSCSLDVADRGGLVLQDVGMILGVTRERTRQIETSALVKLMGDLRQWRPDGAETKQPRKAIKP